MLRGRRGLGVRGVKDEEAAGGRRGTYLNVDDLFDAAALAAGLDVTAVEGPASDSVV